MSTFSLKKPDIDDVLHEHFQFLGVGSVAAYKLWCYRHGLSTGLDKTPRQRQAEIDLIESQQQKRDPDISPHHIPRRAEYIARIFKGELQNDTLSDMLFRIRTMFDNLDGDPGAQQALGSLVLHAEKYSILTRPIRASGRFGHTVTNTYVAALEQLARHHTDWIRPVEDWRPESHKSRSQFNALARHLLAKYDVPPFFDLAFFQGATPQAQQEQGWFKHVGMGQNIRTAGVPMRITKRMAHLFMQERSQIPPAEPEA